MTEAPVGTRGGMPQLATYETEPQISHKPTRPIDAPPPSRARGLVLGCRAAATLQCGKGGNARTICVSNRPLRDADQAFLPCTATAGISSWPAYVVTIASAIMWLVPPSPPEMEQRVAANAD